MRTPSATFHGSPCKRNHSTPLGTLRYVSSRECVGCSMERSQERARVRKEARQARAHSPRCPRKSNRVNLKPVPVGALCSCGDPAQAGSYFCSEACKDGANWEFSVVASPFLGGSGR